MGNNQYGARAEMQASSSASVSDADIFRVLAQGRTRRGVNVRKKVSNWTLWKKIYGGEHEDFLLGYEVREFFKTLGDSITANVQTAPFIPANAAQASVQIMDKSDTPALLFTVLAGFRGIADKSSFGNGLAVKLSLSYDITYNLTANTTAGATSLPLNGIDQLKEGHICQITDGSHTELFRVISVDKQTKTAVISTGRTTSTGLTNTFSAAAAVVSRVDITVRVGLKVDGVYEEQEKFSEAYMLSDSGIVEVVNNSLSGAFNIIMDFNNENASTIDKALPSTLDSWIALSGGTDGDGAADSNYSDMLEGMKDLKAVFFISPESQSVAHNQAMAAFSTSGYKHLFYPAMPFGANDEVLQNHGVSLRQPKVFAMIPADKWRQVDCPYSRTGQRWIPGVGIAIAHYFNSYVANGIGQVAAGNFYPVNTSAKLYDNGIEYNKGVGPSLIKNCSVNIAMYKEGEGHTYNSARTCSTDLGYMYQHQIILWLFIRDSIVEYLRLQREQRPNKRKTQQAIYNDIWRFGKNLYDAEVFYEGQKEDGTDTAFKDVFKIANDITVNTLEKMAKGELWNIVSFIAAPVLEDPILSLGSNPITALATAIAS